MHRLFVALSFLLLIRTSLGAEETFVTIHKVSGSRIQVTLGPSAGGSGKGMRSVGAAGQSSTRENIRNREGDSGDGRATGRGRRGGDSSYALSALTVPVDAKITSAMRERRTYEFRVLGELPGGLRHRVFQQLQEPLSARIVTKDNRITEINVITGDTDINHTGTSAAGETVIAVRPKRPPAKRNP